MDVSFVLLAIHQSLSIPKPSNGIDFWTNISLHFRVKLANIVNAGVDFEERLQEVNLRSDLRNRESEILNRFQSHGSR